LQIGADAERLVARPDHQALVAGLGQIDGAAQALGDTGANGVHLALDAGDEHASHVALLQRPEADVGVFVNGLASAVEGLSALAEQGLAEQLAPIHRQFAPGLELAQAGVPRAFGLVHATARGHRAVKDPIGQRRAAQRQPGVDVGLHHLRHLEPAGFLPELEWALLHAKAPAHGLIDVARAVGNGGQVQRGVVKAVAQYRPQKTPLRPFGVAQQLEALGRRLFEHAAIDFVGLLALAVGAGHVVAAFEFEAVDVAPHLLEKTGLGFLAQVPEF